MRYPEFADLVGRKVLKAEGVVGDDAIIFTLENGVSVKLWHEQNCCACVEVSDICGDLSDLEGQVILQAEEVSHDANSDERTDYSGTWTFYKISSVKGSVTLSWLGESNGYYNESVDCTWSFPDDHMWHGVCDRCGLGFSCEQRRIDSLRSSQDHHTKCPKCGGYVEVFPDGF